MPPEHFNDSIRFEPDEHPPWPVTLGIGFQSTLVVLAPIVITVAIVAQIAEQPMTYVSWAAFAALLISGVTTALQSARLGRFGAGHVLIMGTSGVFIAVCVSALTQGGPTTMASLVVVSALFQFALAVRLSWLRRIFTPAVSGTVIMLIAVTVMPIVFDTLSQAPEGTPSFAPPIAALATLITIVMAVLRAPPQWRLWAPLLGIAVGSVVTLPFGLYDMQEVAAAPWIGLPQGTWPGLDLIPDQTFWALLPAFVVATIVGAIETLGDGVAIQTISRRRPRATDFRVVQGALNTDGLGNLLSGLMGTLPNTTYSSSISLAEVTGVAARRVGIVIGILLAALAFFPKVAALLIAIPGPVVAAYVLLLLSLLFIQGMKIVVQDGLDHRKATVAGVAFWLGVGFQNKVIFPELLGDGFLALLLDNGMTAGALAAILMMAFMELTAPRRQRLVVDLDVASLPRISEFLRGYVARMGWQDPAIERLLAAGEETLAILQQEGDDPATGARRLAVTVCMQGHTAEVEFKAALADVNMEDHLAAMDGLPPVPDEREVSFRLLQHYASSVRHQKYHGMDIVTVLVQGKR